MFNANQFGEMLANLFPYFLVVYAIFFINLYIFRSIFNIPTFLEYQKAQIRLLEEISKRQAVVDKPVDGIVSETQGWTLPMSETQSTTEQ